MTGKWRAGILGLGHWYSCNGLAQGLSEYPKAELIAVAYHDEGKAHEFSATFDIEAYADYDELLARSDIDIVHIARRWLSSRLAPSRPLRQESTW